MKELTPIIAAVTGFIITALSGAVIIPFLRKLKFGQTIREDGPKWHMEKQGTPTMGGIMIFLGVFAAIAVSLVYAFSVKNSVYDELKDTFSFVQIAAAFGLSLGMGFIGFIDDYLKVVKKRNLGLTAKQKTALQGLVTLGYLITLYLSGMNETYIPIAGWIKIDSGIGLIFWPIAFFFIYGFVNAVNLTDGVDGLASSVTLVVCCFFMFVCGYLTFMSANALAAALSGALVGFLVWNAHPAKVFMGDTGSLFLGGAVVGLSFCIERPVILILVGVIYLAEAFSVVLQVAYFKKTKKRLFKMSPIHHHFELSGWKEEKIVIVFSAVTLVFSALSALIIL